MGIVFVLLLYAVVLTVVAGAAAALLGLATHLLVRRSPAGKKRATTAAILFPFCCVAYAGAWFVAYSVINLAVFNRDPGLGDSWDTPLPNGYAINMIDVMDHGTVYSPNGQSPLGNAVSGPEAISGVRQVQVEGRFIFGASDTDYSAHLSQDSSAVNSYFEIDTSEKSTRQFPSLDALRSAASASGTSLKLEPIAAVFYRFRITWFDRTAWIFLAVVPLGGFVILVRYVWRTRTNAYAHFEESDVQDAGNYLPWRR